MSQWEDLREGQQKLPREQIPVARPDTACVISRTKGGHLNAQNVPSNESLKSIAAKYVAPVQTRPAQHAESPLIRAPFQLENSYSSGWPCAACYPGPLPHASPACESVLSSYSAHKRWGCMRPQRGNPETTQCGHAQPGTCKGHMPGCMHQMACNPLVGPLHSSCQQPCNGTDVRA